MICLICRQANIVRALSSVVFEKDERKQRIGGVPSLVCPHCGETYVEETVARTILQAAEDMLKRGVPEGDIEYNAIGWHP